MTVLFLEYTVYMASNRNLYYVGNQDISTYSVPAALLVSDTSGNMIDSVHFDSHSLSYPDIISLRNHELLISSETSYGSFCHKGYISKFDTNLVISGFQNDSIDYDFLCEGNVLTDTIFLDGDIITGIDKNHLGLKTIRLKVFPNPAHQTIVIEMPEYFATASNKSHNSITKRYFQEGELQIFDIHGKKLFSEKVNPKETLNLDIKAFKPSLYLVILKVNHKIAASAKFLKQ